MYSVSTSEINFVSLFRKIQVDTFWVEVRSNPDRIVAFVYAPSRRFAHPELIKKLQETAPVFVLYPVQNFNCFVFGADKEGKSFRTILSEDEVLSLVNADWSREAVLSMLKYKSVILNGKDYFPKTYSQFKAKRTFSDLHFKAKKDAYMFDIDACLLLPAGTKFVEYKHGDEPATYNEKVGYNILSQKKFQTYMVRGVNCFDVFRFYGFAEEFVCSLHPDEVEKFFLNAK